MISQLAKQRATELIKSFEGFSEVPYWDRTGWAIGYGTHVSPPPDRISREAAEKLVRDKVEQYAAVLGRQIRTKLSDEQWAAVLSWAYNVGLGRATRSRLVVLLKQGKLEEAAAEFDRWVYSGGRKLGGLVARRRKERAVFEGKEERLA